MTAQRLNELVGKLESITNGGLNELTQDDYGDLYGIVFDMQQTEIRALAQPAAPAGERK